jgi:hypothetical protein
MGDANKAATCIVCITVGISFIGFAIVNHL